MNKLSLKITLISDALVGSGEGFGAVIDSDVVFDRNGLPFIPARRVKGLLRDSLTRVLNMFDISHISWVKGTDSDKKISEIMGGPGQVLSAGINLSNLFPDDYENNSRWIQYLISKYTNTISAETVRNNFTNIRHNIAIVDNETAKDDSSDKNHIGTTKEHSLRTFRVLNKGLSFYGCLEIETVTDNLHLLALSCCALRRIGTKRNRGFGEIECDLLNEDKVSVIPEALKILEERI
ncbi:MAG: RAMP superfamily CRISPR-associated protein [Ignavibacteria bacterium]